MVFEIGTPDLIPTFLNNDTDEINPLNQVFFQQQDSIFIRKKKVETSKWTYSTLLRMKYLPFIGKDFVPLLN